MFLTYTVFIFNI